MPIGSARVCKSLLDSGAKIQMQVSCTGAEILTDANNLDEKDAKRIEDTFAKVDELLTKLLASLQE